MAEDVVALTRLGSLRHTSRLDLVKLPCETWPGSHLRPLQYGARARWVALVPSVSIVRRYNRWCHVPYAIPVAQTTTETAWEHGVSCEINILEFGTSPQSQIS